MNGKPLEFYVAIAAAALYVFQSNEDKPFKSRFLITMASAGFGFSIAPDLTAYIGWSLTITGILVTALGFLALETVSAMVSDVPFVKGLIQKKFGQ
jgi:hypothetical protein